MMDLNQVMKSMANTNHPMKGEIETQAIRLTIILIPPEKYY